ncbi:uncharacterized protein LOC126788172 [Argentina anserina]|uniref:uncharacterized protein LOC126788172 n=1 Tax=Argentina anserina TaxID=57926 RepID=UPI0021769536|nr:uncharacterized protein LOC126788172 [Potentilla anserina]XP_050370101.1 uncharacterized protein LOC126788172 [Potentilla anserina]
MDSKFKGPKWMGNIYQKFEAICQEVDDIVKQDTIKYVENQMQSVGKNVKKLCSDLLPPLGHPVKHVAEDVAIEKNTTSSTKTRKSLQENSVEASERQSPTEANIIDPASSQPSLISTDHYHGDQLSSLASVVTLEEPEVDVIMAIETSVANNEKIAKPVLSKLTCAGGEEHFAESLVGEFDQSNYENRLGDFSEDETSTDDLNFGSKPKVQRGNFSDEVECVSGVSTVMVSTTEPKVMDPENQLSFVSSKYHLLEQHGSPTSVDTLKASESNLCMGKTDGILTNEIHDANNNEFFIKSYAPLLSKSTPPGVVEHFTMSPVRDFVQSNDANRYADSFKDEPETSTHEVQLESLQNWTLWDDYVDKIECVPDALNSTSEMSFSVVSVENPTEDAELVSFSRSNAEESLRISENSLEKLTQEAIFCHKSVEGVSFVSNFSDAAYETSAHSLECQLDSTAWDDFDDETECDFASSSTASGMVYSAVSGENSIEKTGVKSLNCSNATPLGLSEDSSLKLSGKAMLCHNPIEAFSKNKDKDGRLSSFSSSLSVAEGTSRITETIPPTVPCGKQQVKICESFQHNTAITSSDTECLDELSSDIAYCHMESIDLHDKVQIQEKCVNVEDSVLRAISRRARKQRSYKKQIQDAFTSKKRLVKEYEQLAVWFGDVSLNPSQEVTSSKDNSGTHHAGDSEWELV